MRACVRTRVPAHPHGEDRGTPLRPHTPCALFPPPTHPHTNPRAHNPPAREGGRLLLQQQRGGGDVVDADGEAAVADPARRQPGQAVHALGGGAGGVVSVEHLGGTGRGARKRMGARKRGEGARKRKGGGVERVLQASRQESDRHVPRCAHTTPVRRCVRSTGRPHKRSTARTWKSPDLLPPPSVALPSRPDTSSLLRKHTHLGGQRRGEVEGGG